MTAVWPRTWIAAVRRRGGDRGGRRRERRTLTVQHDARDDGDREDVATLIRAVVHARLLGMRLLTLDARVVVANNVDPMRDRLAAPDRLALVAPDPRTVPFERTASRPGRSGNAAPTKATAAMRAVDGDVTTARALLAQGADTLARVRAGSRNHPEF
jgi:hypothetical protein